MVLVLVRGDVKYYFADFVCKGGNPPPLYGLFFRQGGSYGFGGYPLPPFTDTIFGEEGVTDLGGTLPPLYGQNPQSSI